MTMQKQILFILLPFLLAAAPFNHSHASVAAPLPEVRAHLLEKARQQLAAPAGAEKQEKRLERLEKRLAKRLAKSNTGGPDFSDPVDKWLWFGLFGLGLAIILGAIGGFGLGGLVGLAAVVCLVIWVIKYSERQA